MSYLVIARKYRPSTFDEIVGQEAIVRALGNAIRLDRVAHAYLFSGPRGVGKTTTARLLAKALNCQKGGKKFFCNRCDICSSIAAGSDLDVLEIDGASNRGIDEVREIRQNLNFLPTRGKYRVYIIDEVHMLTMPAFNALLKSIEEPPAHVKFILATTAPQKVPETIRSRCQHLTFRRVPSVTIAKSLARIAKAEGIEADEAALMAIARSAAGGMRDAQSLLDQLSSMTEGSIGVDDVGAILGTVGEEELAAMAEAIIGGEESVALELVGAAIEAGRDIGDLTEQMIAYFRELLVVGCCGTESELAAESPFSHARLLEQSQRITPGAVAHAIDQLTRVRSSQVSGLAGRTLLEATVVKLAGVAEATPVADALDTLSRIESGLERTPVPAPAAAGVRRKAAPSKEAVEAPAGEAAPEDDLENLPLLERVGRGVIERGRKATGTVIMSGRIDEKGGGAFELVLPAGQSFHRARIEERTTKQMIEEILREITGEQATLTVSLEKARGKKGESGGPTKGDLRGRTMADPLVKEVAETFGARIIRVEA